MTNSNLARSGSVDDTTLPRALWIVLAVGLLLRIGWVLAVPVIPESDVMAYDAFARTLANHGVFGWTKDEPFAFWAPGTSMIYGLVYALAGFSYTNVAIVNLLASAVMIVCTARVAARFFGPQVAVVAAAVLAGWPTLVMFSTLLASEVLYLALAMAAFDVWTMRRDRVVLRGLAAGLLLGMATLVRPMALLLPFVFAASLLLGGGWRRDELMPQLRLGVLAFVALGAVLAPWVWRNYQLYGGLVLVSTNSGTILWMGNAPGPDAILGKLPPVVKGLNDYETNKILGAMARQHILDDPAGFVVRSLQRVVQLFNNESIGAHWNSRGLKAAWDLDVYWFKRLTQVSWGLIFVTACAGAVLLVRRLGLLKGLASPMLLPVLYYTAIHAIVLATDRYHLVMAPQIAVLAGVALVAAGQRWGVTGPAAPRPATAPHG